MTFHVWQVLDEVERATRAGGAGGAQGAGSSSGGAGEAYVPRAHRPRSWSRGFPRLLRTVGEPRHGQAGLRAAGSELPRPMRRMRSTWRDGPAWRLSARFGLASPAAAGGGTAGGGAGSSAGGAGDSVVGPVAAAGEPPEVFVPLVTPPPPPPRRQRPSNSGQASSASSPRPTGEMTPALSSDDVASMPRVASDLMIDLLLPPPGMPPPPPPRRHRQQTQIWI